MYQEKFLEDKSNRIIACAGRQVGKSLVSAAKALWFSITHPRTTALIVSATQRQSSLMFDKILKYIEGSYFLGQLIQRKTRTMIRFVNGSEIKALPCGRQGATLRGETIHFGIIDEAAFVPEEVITQVITPMLSTTDGNLIMISTPYDKSHFFYRAFHSSHWSKYQFKTEDNPLVKEEFLAEQKEQLGDKQFRQEYLAEFVDDEKTYFPMALLRSCVHVCDDSRPCSFCAVEAQKSGPSGEMYAGYDPGGMTDPAALVVVQKTTSNEKPVFNVVLTKTFLAKSPETKGVAPSDIYTRFTVEVSDLHSKLRFRKLLVDSTGIGSPIVEHCRELKLPVQGVSLGRVKQEEIFSNLKILLEQTKIVLPDNLELLSSLNCITANRNRTGGYLFDHGKGTHDDLAFALALAVRAAGSNSTIIMNLR